MESTLNEPEIKALISLLDDTDKDVYFHIEERLIGLGREVIPILEDAWSNAFDAVMQQRIEFIVHKIQYDSLNAIFFICRNLISDENINFLSLFST